MLRTQLTVSFRSWSCQRITLTVLFLPWKTFTFVAKTFGSALQRSDTILDLSSGGQHMAGEVGA